MTILLFVVYAGLVGFLSLSSGTGVGNEPWDKVQHLLVYYIFAVLAYRAFSARRGYWLICLGIIAYGGLLELAQSYTPERVMSVYDMLANAGGVLLGAAVASRRRKILKVDGE